MRLRPFSSSFSSPEAKLGEKFKGVVHLFLYKELLARYSVLGAETYAKVQLR